MDHTSHENGHCSNKAAEPANFSSHSTDDFKTSIHRMKKTALRHLLVTVAGLAAALVPISVPAAPGDLYETDYGSGMIFKFTPPGTKSTFASGLNHPYAAAFDGSGNLFEADQGSGTIFKFTPAGTKSTFASGLNNPTGLAFDGSGNLFEADNGSNTIFIFTPGGTRSTFASGLDGPAGLAFEPTRHQFLNISTRALVGTGDGVLIGGFIMNGNGQVDDVALVRAIGPSLTAFGVAGALQDPTLELHGPDGTIIATNDNWKETQQALIQSTGLAPTDDRESAIYATLPAGHYTAIVRGVGNTTGVAIVEVYNLQ
jgi:hypothetical protein